jgi:hypothetical protein
MGASAERGANGAAERIRGGHSRSADGELPQVTMQHRTGGQHADCGPVTNGASATSAVVIEIAVGPEVSSKGRIGMAAR